MTDRLSLSHLVLMVEDDRMAATVQREWLSQAGLSVFAVATGSDALLWAPVLPLAAILLDISLPDMDGAVVALHLARSQRETGHQSVPVIALTALDQGAEPRIDALNGLRLAAIWAKPLDPDKINLLRTMGSGNAAAHFRAYDPIIAQDVASALQGREVGLRQQLMQQVQDFRQLFATQQTAGLGFAAHALKSSALAMGYNNLAALMSAIELASHSQGALLRENDNILQACLAAVNIN